jgi:threonine/homoserine/homoserine lactone efflux protein
MNILEFAAEVVFLSASGVLAPGPLFFANLIYGIKQGSRAGFKIALGHTIVEFPLIFLLALGLFGFSSIILSNESLRVIGLVGAAAIIFFSISQISDIIKRRKRRRVGKDNNNYNNSNPIFKINIIKRRLERPLIIGIVFSALNPFFLVWWLTVGLKLISDSVYLFNTIVAGAIFLFSFHIWMDYAWLGATSYMIYKGRSILKVKFYHIFVFSISMILASYGIYLIISNMFLMD